MRKQLEKRKDQQRRIPREDEIRVGDWYWMKDDGKRYLTCVTHVGSNYAKLSTPGHSQWRIHLEKFDCEREPNPEKHIQEQIVRRRANIDQLLGRVRQLCSDLGLSQIAAGTQESALVKAHGVADVKAHRKALKKAKDKTLPDLFKQIEQENKEMAHWMSATLLPLHADIKKLRRQTEAIEDRILTVQLYAGLVEEVKRISGGKSAPADTPVHVYQRRHYMDEECLAHYEAGGMSFKDLAAFDKWIARPKNRDRILPFPRCVVAFRIRRNTKEREAVTLGDFFRIVKEAEADQKTFLYMRNGQRLYRLATEIEFDEKLFPDQDHDLLLGDGHELWVDTDFGTKLITDGEFEERVREYEQKKQEHEQEMREWEAEPEEKGFPPHFWECDPRDKFERVTQESVYYDDAMNKVANEARKHNRLAVVLQGLLDRSPVFHPHPPWRLWVADEFSRAVTLVFDDSRALTPGDVPDFEAYRRRLNSSLKRGSITVGQHQAWEQQEIEKDYERQCNDWRIRHPIRWQSWNHSDDPGPGRLARVIQLGRDGSCSYRWKRGRRSHRWVPNPERPGYLKRDNSKLTAKFRCPQGEVLNVDAYTPGDFKIFFSDPRTRADYLKWAPLLLAAEDYHAGKRKVDDGMADED